MKLSQVEKYTWRAVKVVVFGDKVCTGIIVTWDVFILFLMIAPKHNCYLRVELHVKNSLIIKLIDNLVMKHIIGNLMWKRIMCLMKYVFDDFPNVCLINHFTWQDDESTLMCCILLKLLYKSFVKSNVSNKEENIDNWKWLGSTSHLKYGFFWATLKILFDGVPVLTGE